MIRVVLFDLDGVIRHFDPTYVADIELRHGLAAGALEAVAFTEPLVGEVTTGRISRADWVRKVSDVVGNVEAAEEWSVHPAVVDQEMLHLADEVRELGLRSAILTNGTDTIPVEIAALGIADRFDAIFNSADIGFAKPDPRAFQHVLDDLEVEAHEVFFTDDSAHKLAGADRLSMCVHLFQGVDGLRCALFAAGVKVGTPSSEKFRRPHIS